MSFSLGLAHALTPLCASALLLWACGGNSSGAPDAGLDAHVPGPAQALFVLPGTAPDDGFFALPYPNNLRISEEGLVDLDELVRPNAFMADYFDTIASLQTGFGLTSASFMRFDAPIDPSSLPSEPIRSQIPDASVYLVNLEQSSPNYGRKVPVEIAFHPDGGEIIGDNWLACLPFPGIVLEEDSDYALVATNRILAEDGSPVSAAPAFADIMASSTSTNSQIAAAQSLYEPLTRWLDEPGGDERSDVVNASVFTTQSPTRLMGKFREVIYESYPEPKAREIEWRTERRGYAVYTGRYDSPNFQAGEYPYKALEHGGGFVLDADGDPIVQSTYDLRFSMTIPTGKPMPEDGWPIILYAHGTTGDYLSYESNGTAARMAEQGIAVISIDQVMHGDRLDGGDVQTLFFNFQNPLSSRANVIQAALENYQLLRLVKNFEHVERHVGGRTIRFDGSKIMFMGHSQGSVTGVPFSAYEPEVIGTIFSGAGGLLLLTLITKTEPFDIRELVRLIIRDAEITRFHPALSFLQAFYEPADGIVYGRLLVHEPPEGMSPKNVFQPIGLADNYTTVPTMHALATAMGLDQVSPVLDPIEGLELLEKRVLNAPVTNNAETVTAVAAQYEPMGGADGHFVSFDIPAAMIQSAEFFGSLVRTGEATIVKP